MSHSQTSTGRGRAKLLALLVLLTGGCTNQPTHNDSLERALKPVTSRLGDASTDTNTAPAPEADHPAAGFYQPGSGKLVGKPHPIAKMDEQGGDITLNFQNTNLLEVIKVMLGDMLGVNYIVDARVQGSVTLQTSRPLQRDDLLPTLEMLLRMNGAALVPDGQLYRVVPLASAAGDVASPQLGDTSLPLPHGYSVRVVPLQYIAAEEMAQILQPFAAGSNQVLRVDQQRNLLILAASGDDMSRLMETIRIFDVDRMAGMSVALFTPEFVDAKTLGEELQKVLADKDKGLLKGLVRFEVIQRLNGLMVVTPRAELLAQVRNWVQRLDQDSGGAGQRLFFYRVHNGKAADLAEVLNQLFEPEQQAPPAQLAPGLQLAESTSPAPVTPQPQGAAPRPAAKPARPAAKPARAGNGLAFSPRAKVKVIADEPNNALLILASGSEYRQILAALKQLDAVPLQVLIEVTIAEVSLTNNLEYGVEWFFNNKLGSYTGRGTLELGLTDIGAAGIAGATSGVQAFSYALTRGGNVNGLLNLLAEESNISIISSPSLLVLNNQEARIQVGDEISIKTAEQSSVTAGTDTALTSTFERRETGVLLTVKPRVNPGGLVIMDVEQEVSNVPQADVGSDNPRIQKRNIKSTVAVQSGDSVMLGGLIKDNRDHTETGVPVVHQVPVLGTLFGNKADNSDRTELLVVITPRAITDRNNALQVTDEFRRKLNTLIPKKHRATKQAAPN
jgi:general secretion pathway protein D